MKKEQTYSRVKYKENKKDILKKDEEYNIVKEKIDFLKDKRNNLKKELKFLKKQKKVIKNYLLEKTDE